MPYTVDPKSGCWNWNSEPASGYPFVCIRQSRLLAHRVMYWMKHGNPDGYDIHHICRNTRCVNPDHLERLTREEHTRWHRRKENKFRDRERIRVQSFIEAEKMKIGKKNLAQALDLGQMS